MHPDKIAYVEQAPSSSFLQPVQDADEQMSNLLNRIESLADRLCGSAPESAGREVKSLRGIPSGAFDTAAQYGRDIQSKVNTAHDFISRIERALP